MNRRIVGTALIAMSRGRRIECSAALVCALVVLAGCQIVLPVAGGPGGPGPAKGIAISPVGIAHDVLGNFFIADLDNGVIRAVDPAGAERNVAGTGVVGDTGDGGLANSAQVSPTGVAVDANDNLLIPVTDFRIRVVAAHAGTFYGLPMTASHIYTIAGNGTPGYSGDGGPARSAMIQSQGLAVDAAGNIIIADTGNNRTRVMAATTDTFYGMAMTAGDIYTVAGNGTAGYSGDRGPATSATIAAPLHVTVDHRGNLVLGSDSPPVVRVVADSRGTFYGVAMMAGDIYTVAGNGSSAYSGDGGPAISAGATQIVDVAVDAQGNLLAADFGRLRVVAATTGTFYGVAMTANDIYTVAGDGTCCVSAGDGGPAAASKVSPSGLTVDSHGNLIVADHSDQVVRVVATSTGRFYGQAMISGDIYTVAGNGRSFSGGDGGPAVVAQLSPTAVAVDSHANVLISDAGDARIRMVAATNGTFYGKSMTTGDIYTVAGRGSAGDGGPGVGDGGPATSALLSGPGSVAVDHHDNLIILDSFLAGPNNRVRVVAATTGTFYGMAMTAGNIYTIAGNIPATSSCANPTNGQPAISADLCSPTSVTVDAPGDLVITDNVWVRVMAATTGTHYGISMVAADMYTVAGNGGGFPASGDGGPATSAQLHPDGVAIDPAGNLVVTDSQNGLARILAVATGTFYGTAMTAGDIYTVAGGGNDSGAGEPATSALIAPSSVAVDANGNLVMIDGAAGSAQVIRVVAERTGTFYNQPMTAGDIYSIDGSGQSLAIEPSGDVLVANQATNRLTEVLPCAPAGSNCQS